MEEKTKKNKAKLQARYATNAVYSSILEFHLTNGIKWAAH